MNRILATLFIYLLAIAPGASQYQRTKVYGEHDGLSHRHVTQMLQDKYGFLWFSTWNGLDRFDGREFVTFKSRPGDGIDMPSDRIRKIAIDNHDANILNCRIDDSWYRFSLLTGKFSPAGTNESKLLSKNSGYGFGKTVEEDGIRRFRLKDRQGLLWTILDDGISVSIPNESSLQVISWDSLSEVKSIFTDFIGRTWVATRDGKVRIYDNGAVGYLTSGGVISSQPSTFPSPIYCIYGDALTGDIWLGSKPGGLYRLQRRGTGFDITHIEAPKGFNIQDVYDIAHDRHGRLWLATMSNGLVCIDHGHYTSIRFGRENKVRRIAFSDPDLLVAATTEGLLTVDITPGHGNHWRLHRRQPNRTSSLSNNACMDIAGLDGKWYVATESGGVNMTEDNLDSSSLSFRHYDSNSGLGSDVILSLTPFSSSSGPCILVVTNSSLIVINQRTGESREFNDAFFGMPLSFSDARPLYDSKKNKWIIGLRNGIAVIDGSMLNPDNSIFPIVLTSLTKENEPTDYMVNGLNEIHLTPDERTVDISFAVLDYRNPANIRYAYRIRGDADWHYLGNGNHIRLAELSPGDYLLDLKATNAMGTWSPKIRTLSIIVEPKFIETVWFKILITLVTAALILAVFFTIMFIRRMKAKQKETLEAYLSLLEKSKETSQSPSVPSRTLSEEDEALMNRIMAFVEAHISDSEIGIDDMASASAMSRSSLNRKMKSLVGLTPGDFLREARIKRAKELLTENGASVASVAYRCGFADPKYFSRVFRQSTGVSPSEYKSRK